MVVYAGSALASAVIHAPFVDAWNMVEKFDSISRWGCGVVTACFMENAQESETPGAIRVSTLHANDRVTLREKLLSVDHTRHTASMAYAAMPCDTSPFPCPIANLITTLSLRSVTTEARKTYVELSSTFACRSGEDANLAATFLQQQLFDPLLSCLEEYALTVRYNLDVVKEDTYHRQYKEYESELVDLTVTPGMERAKNAYEKLFVAWVGLAREVRQLEGVLQQIDEDAAASRLVEAAAHELATEDDDKAAVVEVQKPEHAEPQQKAVRRSLHDAPNNVLSVPSLLHSALVCGCVLSQQQLHEAFDELDADQRGYLTVEEVRDYWNKTEHFGLDTPRNRSFSDDWMARNVSVRDRMNFDEFCHFMFELAKR